MYNAKEARWKCLEAEEPRREGKEEERVERGVCMSPWLCNFFFDKVIKKVNERAVGRGVKLRDEKGGGWEINQVLYADDSFGT